MKQTRLKIDHTDMAVAITREVLDENVKLREENRLVGQLLLETVQIITSSLDNTDTLEQLQNSLVDLVGQVLTQLKGRIKERSGDE